MSTPHVRTPDANFVSLAEFPFAPHYLDIDGLRMHYVDEGPRDAPVALMIHGMPTWSYLYRKIIPPMIAAGYRCIAPDHIGFGRSDKVTDPAWYDIARHTANLARLVTALGVHDITLFVQDWGGPTGLAQVATMPERFSRLVIMNTWLHHDAFDYSPAIRTWIQQNLLDSTSRPLRLGRPGRRVPASVGTKLARPDPARHLGRAPRRRPLPPGDPRPTHRRDRPRGTRGRRRARQALPLKEEDLRRKG